MPKLYDNGTGDLIGEISDDQLQFLKDQLEEESLEDRDYAIEEMTLEYFEEQNGDPELINSSSVGNNLYQVLYLYYRS
jgi:hypothetical protein